MSVRRLSLLVLGLVSLVVVGCARPPPTPVPPAAVAVRTAPVVREKVLRPIRAAGRLGGKQEMSLAFRSAGTVDRILVREGQTVRRGQVLATLDTLDADAALVQATA
ncbi:MAG TPA: biotin/lipoyl-binding protein, partial [Myxococcaceae bacterium]|nr:biotin/lipoyl-binding protein [Myxococcaceae bacterium]